MLEDTELLEYLEDKKRLIKSAQSFVLKSYAKHPEWSADQLQVALSSFIKNRSDTIFGGIDVRADRQLYKESLTKRTIEGAQFDALREDNSLSATGNVKFILALTKIYKIESFSNMIAYLRYLVKKPDNHCNSRPA